MMRLQLTREALRVSIRSRRLWVAQFLLNPVLFGVLVFWLLIPESRVWQLALSAVLAVLLAGSAIVLHAGTLIFFYDTNTQTAPTLGAAFGRAAKHIFALAIWLFILYVIWIQIDRLGNYEDTWPTYWRSLLPLFLRRYVSEAGISELLAAFIFGLRWVLLPGLSLPVALQLADRGFKGGGRARMAVCLGVLRSAQYWMVLVVAVLAGVYFAGLIMHARPLEHTSLSRETFWFAGRLFISYLLALSSWMFFCSALGRSSRLHAESAGKAAG